MEFRETLLAAQRNQQQKSSDNVYYKARFDPPKKEQKSKDKLSANIQKFLAKKEEEEKQKKLEIQKKKADLLAMRDPKALRKIQKTLKVIKSANKSVIEDAIDRDNTALTREGPSQPDQDDYGYESQEAAAIYQKMMEKYSKLPDEPKFPTSGAKSKKDLDGTRERVKQALLHEDDPVPHKRRRRTDNGEGDKEPSPPRDAESERRKDKDKDKPKVRRPAPPPMDFNQLLKLAELKKCEPVEAPRRAAPEPEPARLMTKRQRREHEEEVARRQRRQERLDGEKGRKVPPKEERAQEKERPLSRKPESSGSTANSGFARIPKLGDKASPKVDNATSSSKIDKEIANEREKIEKLQREKAKLDKERTERDKERQDRDRLEKLKAERERIEKDIERLNRDRERLEKTKQKLESGSRPEKRPGKEDFKKPIDIKSQNTYRIDKNSNERRPAASRDETNGHSAKEASKLRERLNGDKLENGKKVSDAGRAKGRIEDKRPGKGLSQERPKITNSFDFDKHVSSLRGKEPARADPARGKRPDDRKTNNKRRVLDSESEYDSEMDDFIDDGDDTEDYSKHIKEIFGYDKARYRNMDDGDDPSMESSFSRQMQEEYISKKIGIMEDLEDIRLEKQMMKKKKRRIDD